MPKAQRVQEDLTLARHYILTDLADEPNWDGSLVLLARQYEVLSSFRISDLSLDLVYLAWAADKSKHTVYYYNAVWPESNINTIYDDMPLEGWWPWPKKESERAARQGKV